MADDLHPPDWVVPARIALHTVAVAVTIATVLLLGGFSIFEDWGVSPKLTAVVLVSAALGTMILYDSIFIRFVAEKYGHDPHDLHWSERLSVDGWPMCPDCGSKCLDQPRSQRDEDYVRCGDCGCAIAQLGEMRDFLEDGRDWLASRYGL